MNDSSNTRFFCLLADSSQEIAIEEMQNAYGQFIINMEVVSNSDDYSTIFRTLNLSRIEIASLECMYQYEQGKKCLEIFLPTKSIILS